LRIAVGVRTRIGARIGVVSFVAGHFIRPHERQQAVVGRKCGAAALARLRAARDLAFLYGYLRAFLIRATAIVVVLSTVALVTASSGSAAKKYSVTLIAGTTNDNFYVSMNCGAKAEATKLRCELLVHRAEQGRRQPADPDRQLGDGEASERGADRAH
jgi:hypothetical protein